MTTFAPARDIVATSPDVAELYGEGFTVQSHGWQNVDMIVVDALAADRREMFDAPHASVDKATGELMLHYGLLGKLPADDLTPIGEARH